MTGQVRWMENLQRKNRSSFLVFGLFYCGIFLMVSILSCTLHGISWIQAAKYAVPVLLLFSFLLYASDNERVFGGWKHRLSGRIVLVLTVCGLLSGLLLVTAPWNGMAPLWFVASVAAAVFLGSGVGFGLHLCFCMLWLSFHEAAADFCILLVMGAFFCFLVRYFTVPRNFIAIVLMTVILQLSLLFLANDFLLVGLKSCLWEIGAALCMVAAGFLLSALKGMFLLQRKQQRKGLFSENEPSGPAQKNEATWTKEEPAEDGLLPDQSKEASSVSNAGLKSRLLEMEKPEYVLMARLERASKALYEHSRLVGDTAAKAAELIGADELLTRVGGYYHEIGRLRTDGVKRNYIENGLIHLREHEFPKEVMDIVCQHNIKWEIPKSREAALVMISDSVFSMLEFIRQQGKYDKAKQHEVVENMLRLRFREGNLDDSGMSVREFNLLREYYLNLVETMPPAGAAQQQEP